MNDHWFDWLLGVITVILGAIGKRLHDRLDDLNKNAVTRAELTAAIADLRQDGERKHEQNLGMLERIHDRVDKVWSQLAE